MLREDDRLISLLKAAIHLAALGLLAAPAAVALSALARIGHRWTDLLAQFTAPALAATLVLTLLYAVLAVIEVKLLVTYVKKGAEPFEEPPLVKVGGSDDDRPLTFAY